MDALVIGMVLGLLVGVALSYILLGFSDNFWL